MTDRTADVDYRAWIDLYPSMPLFAGIDPEDVVRLLELIAPPLGTVRAGTSILDDYDPTWFYLCVGSNRDPSAPTPPAHRASFLRPGQWSMPTGPIGTPGLVAGEIMTLSGCDPWAGPKAVWALVDYDVYYLMFTLDDVLEYRDGLYPAQQTMIRNLMGIVAQVVIDHRALFYKLRYGINMFELTDADKQLYAEIHADPLWLE
ncbi:hypothetical protein GCM10009785_31480 [Brooklawnia cerclae]|uniref:Uncharacterized protein n=1 Tax=Brooklawnia cerclae TaxID=349934 RepID=A0ABX0SDT6_9ACTN|nr:hypothetical protein [Brooklawnia cerclae]NIH56562.1 hypothetical protein [Brooklawnia cerclae]